MSKFVLLTRAITKAVLRFVKTTVLVISFASTIAAYGAISNEVDRAVADRLAKANFSKLFSFLMAVVRMITTAKLAAQKILLESCPGMPHLKAFLRGPV